MKTQQLAIHIMLGCGDLWLFIEQLLLPAIISLLLLLGSMALSRETVALADTRWVDLRKVLQAVYQYAGITGFMPEVTVDYAKPYDLKQLVFDADLRDRLKYIGINGLLALIFLHYNSYDCFTASQIGNMVSLPTSSIYSAINKLQEKGYIDLGFCRPSRVDLYQVTTPGMAMVDEFYRNLERFRR